MKKPFIDSCTLLELPKISTLSGNITSLNNKIEAPFQINRVFYIYDVPSGESRGAHAHYNCHQLLVAITGALKVDLFDGLNHRIVNLNKPNIGLHIPPGIWASEFDFSGGAICLVLASHEFEEGDYMRNIDNYLLWKLK
jgi:hypothetical protein